MISSNVCSNFTNKFETEVGMLNIAPTKISGQYKIVYDKNLKPWLDDYTGRRVAVDTSISFLQQVANFLSVSSFLPYTECLRFGGFQRGTVKSWHIPFYYGTNPKLKYPRYFVLAQVPNESFEKEYYDNIYKYGTLVKVVDLSAIGLYKIFEEIDNESYFNYPLYFNHDEKKIQLYGFGIEQQYPCQYTLDLTAVYSNQAYIDVLNNKILNTFSNQKIFYPRFLNIEFEFDYDLPIEQDFNNFYGFLSYHNLHDTNKNLPKNLTDDVLDTKQNEISGGYFLHTRIDKFVYDKEQQLGDYVSDGTDISTETGKFGYLSKLKPYQVPIANGSVNEVNERLPQVRFSLSHLNFGDIFRVHLGNDIDFEYQIEFEDCDFMTFYEQMLFVCRKMTEQSNLDYEFSCELQKSGNVVITCISNVLYDALFEIDSTMEIPPHGVFLDSGNKFKNITQFDVWLCGNQLLTENQTHLVFKDVDDSKGITYRIIETYLFNDNVIVRLVKNDEYQLYLDGEYDKLTPHHIRKLTTAYIEETYVEECVYLKPIEFLTYYTPVTSELQGNLSMYVQSLLRSFAIYDANSKSFPRKLQNPDFLKAIETFSGRTWEQLIIGCADVKLSEAPIGNEDPLYLPYTTQKKNLPLNIDGITITIPIVDTNNIHYQNNQFYQYITQNKFNRNLEDTQSIEVLNNNETLVKDLLFCSMGNTGYLTPNVLNIDRQFWLQNGCVDTDKYRADLLRYTWFLLAGQQPEYLETNHWRYMTRIEQEDGTITYRPRITSRLIKITDSLCETIFLGIKYQLPIQYQDWDFAVYLNYDDSQYLRKTEYLAEVYPEEKLLLLSVNKYLDFTDLIRGGDVTAPPIFDLSLFLNIKTSFNNSSEYFLDFDDDSKLDKKSLLIEPFYDWNNSPVMFNGSVAKDWIQKLDGKYYFCLRASDFDLKTHFKLGEDQSIYIANTIEYAGKKFNYVSMKNTFKGIIELNSDYLWFEDLEVTFFDTREIYLHQRNQETKNEDVLKFEFNNLNKTNVILPYENVEDSKGLYKDWHKVVTFVTDSGHRKFELLLPSDLTEYGERVSKPISLKQDWFRVTKKITETVTGKKNEPVFNNLSNNDYKKSQFIHDYECLVAPSTIKQNYINSVIKDFLKADEASYTGELNLFDRNQIWYIIQDLVGSNSVFKEYSEKLMYQELDKFSIDSLIKLINKNIKIKNASGDDFSDKYINVNVSSTNKNYVVWNIDSTDKVCKINRFNAPYIPLLPIQSEINKFQINQFNYYNTLWNLYDAQFGGLMNDGTKISGTTLWKEVQGNLISTLYCKNDSIVLSTPYTQYYGEQKIDYYELLKLVIDYNKIIVTDDNHKYIESLNKNIKPYIIETYAQTLLSKFYTLDKVTDEEDLRIPYTVDLKKPYTIIIPDRMSLSVKYQSMKNIVLTLVRK